MPYNNQYNQSVATAVRGYSQKHIDRENAINDFSTTYEIPSMLEASVLKDPAVHGGGGFAAATVQDLGIEPTLGATSGEGKAKRVRKKVIEKGEGLSAAGVSAAGTSGGNILFKMFPIPGVSMAAGKPKKAKAKKGKGVSGGALLSLKDMDAMHGQPEPTVQAKVTIKAEGADRAVGGGGLRSRRIAIVKEVMQKHGLSLIAASKYVKEHKLY